MIGYGTRLKFAFTTFFSILDYGRVPDDVVAALGAPAPVAPERAQAAPIEPADRATQLLALLQRDGRLVDFLMEDIGAYGDTQVGAAVRDVHAGCRAALTRYVTLSPVLDGHEGGDVDVPAGVDPAAVKLLGTVTGHPPFHGVLRHRGWKADRTDLPPLPATGRAIVAPAEVEIS